jgi:cytochrome oxidase Cu insertion factor (SCO1/SenC/PrrC family)
MRRILMSLLALSVAVAAPASAQDKKKKEPVLPADSIYKLKAKTLDGKDVDLKDFAGKVTLIVNLASQ